jgi:polar amino acid transport system substrate-binding protein
MQRQLSFESLLRGAQRTSMQAALLAAALGAGLPASAATLDRIRETGHVRFGYLDEARPFSFRSGDGPPDGYAIEICKQVANQLKQDLALPGLTVDWIAVDPDERFSEVSNGRIDLLCAPAVETVSRRKEASFSIPVFASGNRAAIRADTAAALRNALAESRPTKPVWRGTPAARVVEETTFAVVTGTTGEKWLTERAKSLQVNAKIVRLPDYRKALQELHEGKVDVVFGDRVVMLGALQELDQKTRDNTTILDRMFTHEPAGLALHRDDDDFRAAVDHALSRLYASGDFAPLYSKWVGEFDERARTFFVWNTLPE